VLDKLFVGVDNQMQNNYNSRSIINLKKSVGDYLVKGVVLFGG